MAQMRQQQPARERSFDQLLHELRGRELTRLPSGARTILSGGCAGTWYFDWFAERYQGVIDRHIGIESFSPKPDDLPENVEWIDRTLGDLAPVSDGEVDLVFAGEVFEHLWPEDIVGFLAEAHRVLRDDGRIVLDSPNRVVTTALNWRHPEHTVEFTVGEIVELLGLAGFGDLQVRGVWLCYDENAHRYLPLEPDAGDEWSVEQRAAEAEHRPEHSFVWWAEGRREPRDPDRKGLRARIEAIYAEYRALRLARLDHEVGEVVDDLNGGMIAAREGEVGFLVAGPYLPMRPGRWCAAYDVSVPTERINDGAVLGSVDVTKGMTPEVLAAADFTAASVPPDGRLHRVELPFELREVAFGVQFRLRSTGRTGLTARLVGVTEAVDDGSGSEISPASEVGETASNPAVPAQVRGPRVIMRRIGRVLLWPVRRILDPRFQGLGAQLTVVHDDLLHRSDAARTEALETRRDILAGQEATQDALQGALLAAQEAVLASLSGVRAAVDHEIDANDEAATLIGRSLVDLVAETQQVRAQAEWIRELVEKGAYLEEGRRAEDLDARTAKFLNFAEGHRGFAAQRDLWFNPPLSLEYQEGDVVLSAANERIVEVPYVLRALGTLETGSRVLDVGAAESTLAFSLASLGYEVTALDLRPYPLDHPSLRSVVAHVQDWETDETFDGVVCISTIEHIGLGAYGEKPRAKGADAEAMERIWQLTTPGGFLVLTAPIGTPTEDDFQRRYGREGLEALLAEWDVEDVTVIRQTDPATWVVDESGLLGAGNGVALVMARRRA